MRASGELTEGDWLQVALFADYLAMAARVGKLEAHAAVYGCLGVSGVGW